MQPARRNAIRLPQLFTLAVVFALALVGCGASNTPLTATISEPAANTTFQVGQTITISGKANGTGLKMVDVYANTSPLARVDQPTSGNEFNITMSWKPDVSGPVFLLLKGLNDKGESIVSSDPVFITIEGQPTPVLVPTEIPASTAAPLPTAVPPPPAQTTSTASTDAGTPAATAAVASLGGASVVPLGDFANVRNGPGLVYDVVGQLKASQSVTVKGKSDDGAWWQVNFPGAAEGLAWVNGQVVTFTGDATKIAVAKAPPAPTAAPAPVVTQQIVPIAAPTSAAPAPTPIPAAAVLPYAQSVSFDPPNPDYGLYSPGQQVTVRWNIQGATSAVIEIVGKAAPGLYKDCPAGNTGAVAPAANRVPISLPEGNFPFTISAKGYYEVTLYVTKADGKGTTIPFPLSVQCYK